jgi:hypothetical protein
MENKHYEKKQEKISNLIENIYNFKEIWNDKCSKYGINDQPHILPPVDRILVLGDVHGDWKMMISTLKIGKVINDNNEWIGDKTIVVQVGDQIDRCRYNGIPCKYKEATPNDESNDYKILEFFTKLHTEAQAVGGAVYSLLGNHEIMNVEGNIRYVSYKGFEEFESLQKIKQYKKEDGTEFIDGEDIRKWVFKPGNPLSEFLACTRQVALIIGSNLFVHAGIIPDIAKKYNIKNINTLMNLYLLNININTEFLDESKQNIYNKFLKTYVSPLWTRAFGNLGNNNDRCNQLIDPIKEIYKVNKIFVGHTPFLTKGIISACNDDLWLTDYGLSSAFNKYDKDGRSKSRSAHILEILNDGEQINILF